MGTLISAISGGQDWLEASERLGDIHTIAGFSFVMYVVFISFGLMNILTGIFVNSTQMVSEVDRDLVIKQMLEKNLHFAHQIRQVFGAADVDGSGRMKKA